MEMAAAMGSRQCSRRCRRRGAEAAWTRVEVEVKKMRRRGAESALAGPLGVLGALRRPSEQEWNRDRWAGRIMQCMQGGLVPATRKRETRLARPCRITAGFAAERPGWQRHRPGTVHAQPAVPPRRGKAGQGIVTR